MIVDSTMRPGNPLTRVFLSLVSYQVCAFIYSLIFLGLSATPTNTAVPLLLYFQTYAFIVWVCGAWCLSAWIPETLQAGHWKLIAAVAATHAVIVILVGDLAIYGKATTHTGMSLTSGFTMVFVFFVAVAGASSGIVYYFLLKWRALQLRLRTGCQ